MPFCQQQGTGAGEAKPQQEASSSGAGTRPENPLPRNPPETGAGLHIRGRQVRGGRQGCSTTTSSCKLTAAKEQHPHTYLNLQALGPAQNTRGVCSKPPSRLNQHPTDVQDVRGWVWPHGRRAGGGAASLVRHTRCGWPASPQGSLALTDRLTD